MAKAYESDLEKHILSLLQSLEYRCCQGEEFEPDSLGERSYYRQAILEKCLKKAIKLINSNIPQEVCEEAAKKVTDIGFTELLQENRRLHQMMIQGIRVEYWNGEELINERVKLIDWSNKHNEWLAVNQYTVVGNAKRRLDIVCFLNGCPLLYWN